jgi:hypothetical protein
MALIKKIDVEKHFAARRAMRLGRMWPVSQPQTAGSEVARQAANALRLIGDRTAEKSSPRVSPVSIPIAFDSGRNRLLRPPGIRLE